MTAYYIFEQGIRYITILTKIHERNCHNQNKPDYFLKKRGTYRAEQYLTSNLSGHQGTRNVQDD